MAFKFNKVQFLRCLNQMFDRDPFLFLRIALSRLAHDNDVGCYVFFLMLQFGLNSHADFAG